VANHGVDAHVAVRELSHVVRSDAESPCDPAVGGVSMAPVLDPKSHNLNAVAENLMLNVCPVL